MIRIISLLSVALLLLCGGCERSEAPSETAPSETAPSETAPSETAPSATAPSATAPSATAPSATTPSATTPSATAPSATGETTILLHDPVELKRYEVPSQAMLQWFKVRNARPALLLYAGNPLLQRTTPAIQKDLRMRLADNDQASLRFGISDPVIIPNMTLQAALEAGLFSEVYWIMPSQADVSELSIDIFRKQMQQIGALDDKEARTFTLRDGIFSGTVRGLPFHALHPQAKFAINGPAAFHFDLSYLSSLYKGEIKTPIYSLVYQALKQLRQQRIETVSTSFSYSQVSGLIPLGSRFLGDVFVQLFQQPKMLDEHLPSLWQHRANTLYLPELLITEETRNILSQQAHENPEDPSLQYALYNISRKNRSTRQAALTHLSAAVALDPVYAIEYLALAPLAHEKGRTEKALHVLRLAHEALPDNSLITLNLARALLAEDQGESAVLLLQQLLALRWSATIYPGMPDVLNQLLNEATRQVSTEQVKRREQ